MFNCEHQLKSKEFLFGRLKKKMLLLRSNFRFDVPKQLILHNKYESMFIDNILIELTLSTVLIYL